MQVRDSTMQTVNVHVWYFSRWQIEEFVLTGWNRGTRCGLFLTYS